MTWRLWREEEGQKLHGERNEIGSNLFSLLSLLLTPTLFNGIRKWSELWQALIHKIYKIYFIHYWGVGVPLGEGHCGLLTLKWQGSHKKPLGKSPGSGSAELPLDRPKRAFFSKCKTNLRLVTLFRSCHKDTTCFFFHQTSHKNWFGRMRSYNQMDTFCRLPSFHDKNSICT